MRIREWLTSAVASMLVLAPAGAHAFCGFYVGKAGAELYNQASKVVLVRDGDRTVLTLSNDYEGNLKEFALVVPVPSVLERAQIHIGDKRLVDHIDSFSAPRLVEYTDGDPCHVVHYDKKTVIDFNDVTLEGELAKPDGEYVRHGVKVEAQYTVGEYDIVILSAKQSDGLEAWLREQGYAVPPNAAAALAPYIKQGMKFFVARVNLKEQKAGGFSYLRPIQIAYESEKFMLPIRLGMANAKGPQELLVYTLTRRGRVESANYRTVKVPSGDEIPEYLQPEFPRFYAAVFDRAQARTDSRAVHTEYVWSTGFCDPCADTPLSREELRQLGVFWLDEADAPLPFITRLHLRYDAAHFPEDLVFQETGDQETFQARFVIRHPWKGAVDCPAGKKYAETLLERQQKEVQTAAELTGWDVREIAAHSGIAPPQGKEPWYKKLWH